jgi:dihydroorotase-like cyclic amidohydrolase
VTLIRLPGLIDVHAHLRDPGATHKEDFASAGRAAVRGGFTRVLDMPNNPVETVTLERVNDKNKRARRHSLCQIGFHFGTDGHNIDQFALAAAHPAVFGLKVYFDQTTGTLLLNELGDLQPVFATWRSPKPILVHAEDTSLAAAIGLAAAHRRRLHVCHVSLAEEVALIRSAKQAGLSLTAGVCPHHLFLTAADVSRLGSHALMKPPLGQQADQDALWEGLMDGTLDLVETDHAPHTVDEKASDAPPFGVPGLETTLGLLLLAVHDGRLNIEDVARLLHHAPRRVFDLDDQPDTWIELDPSERWLVGDRAYESKAGWSPFVGWELRGPVQRVVSKGRELLTAGELQRT